MDGLVHVSARGDTLACARHRAFIAAHLTLGLGALATFPAYLAVRGGLGPAEAAAFALLVASLGTALLLACTGRFETAQRLSAAMLSALVVLIAVRTGGSSSFALVWALLIPAEAALSGSRRLVAQTAGLAAAAVVAACLADAWGWALPASGLAAQPAFHAAGILVAVLYAGGLASMTQHLDSLGAEMTRSGEARYALLADNAGDLVVRYSAHGCVTYASPAAQALLGVDAADLIGGGLFDRVHVQDRPAYLAALSRAQAGDTESIAEVRLRRSGPDQPQFFWAEVRCRPIPAETRREVVAAIRDIAERKEHESHMEAARAAAERANAAKSAFLATMSHELRTPLNAVIGFSDMLINREALRLDPERQHEYAALIHASGQHLLEVVNGILDMSKLETGKLVLTPEAFDPCALAEGCRQMMGLKAEAGQVTLTLETARPVPEIVADRRALRQICLNLLSNAIKFTPPGGAVVLSLRPSRGGLALAVRDTGIGIGAVDMPRLGEAFFQAASSYDRPYEGTGLGLSVVKGLAALHGGCVDVVSQVGRGTEVTVFLPLDCESETSRAALMPRVRVRPLVQPLVQPLSVAAAPTPSGADAAAASGTTWQPPTWQLPTWQPPTRQPPDWHTPDRQTPTQQEKRRA